MYFTTIKSFNLQVKIAYKLDPSGSNFKLFPAVFYAQMNTSCSGYHAVYFTLMAIKFILLEL